MTTSPTGKILFQSDKILLRHMTLAPLESGRRHFHSTVFETIFCVSGTMALHIERNAKPAILAPGMQASVASPVPHWLENLGVERAEYLLAQCGGVYDFVPANLPGEPG